MGALPPGCLLSGPVRVSHEGESRHTTVWLPRMERGPLNFFLVLPGLPSVTAGGFRWSPQQRPIHMVWRAATAGGSWAGGGGAHMQRNPTDTHGMQYVPPPKLEPNLEQHSGMKQPWPKPKWKPPTQRGINLPPPLKPERLHLEPPFPRQKNDDEEL